MELDKIKLLTDSELVSTRNSAAEQLFRQRFQKSLGNQDGIKKIRILKLDIARTNTIARERELATVRAANPIVKNAAPAKSKRTERKHAAEQRGKKA